MIADEVMRLRNDLGAFVAEFRPALFEIAAAIWYVGNGTPQTSVVLLYSDHERAMSVAKFVLTTWQSVTTTAAFPWLYQTPTWRRNENTLTRTDVNTIMDGDRSISVVEAGNGTIVPPHVTHVMIRPLCSNVAGFLQRWYEFERQ